MEGRLVAGTNKPAMQRKQSAALPSEMEIKEKFHAHTRARGNINSLIRFFTR
jgi:hypothetical protein